MVGAATTHGGLANDQDDASDEEPGPKRVLIIDDDDVHCRTMRTLLERHDQEFLVSEAHEGADGARMAIQGDYDLILLDHMLPDTTGLALLKELRGQEVTAPIVIMTAYGSEEVAVESLKSGANDYLTKEGLDHQRVDRLLDAVRKAPTTLPGPHVHTMDIQANPLLNWIFTTEDPDLIANVGRCLSNPARVALLRAFTGGTRLTLNQAHKEARARDLYQKESSTYRALEDLVSTGLLRKEYQATDKKIEYVLAEPSSITDAHT